MPRSRVLVAPQMFSGGAMETISLVGGYHGPKRKTHDTSDGASTGSLRLSADLAKRVAGLNT